MATNSKKLTRSNLLPDGAKQFVRNRFLEINGIIFMAISTAILLAILSYNPLDPSTNTASAKPVSNWMGEIGSSFADVALQTFGIAITAFGFVIAIWGWRFFRHIGNGKIWVRVLCLPISILLISTAAAGIVVGDNWPLQTGYGGVVGYFLLNEIITKLAPYALLNNIFQPIILWSISFFALAGALGFSIHEWHKGLIAISKIITTIIRSAIFIIFLILKAKVAINQCLRGRLYTRNKKSPLPTHAGQHFSVEAEPKPSKNQASVATIPEQLIAPRKSNTMTQGQSEKAVQQKLDLGSSGTFELPTLEYLQSYKCDSSIFTDESALSYSARILETVLADFGVQGAVTKIRPGPVVTLYEFEPAAGIKSARIIGLADDIARSMSAVSVRVAVIPGKNVMGIELPNTSREIVSLRETLACKEYERPSMQLTLALGKDIGGSAVIADLARMPHLLIAGTTGSGKSVAINTMILSLLYRLPPEKCRLVMIDPKMLELSAYDDIPHLLCPVVTDPKKAVIALRWTVREMEERYRSMSTMGVRNIASYNKRLQEALDCGETLTRTLQTGFDPETGEPVYEEQTLDMKQLPYIVVVVDEMADLMLVAGKEVEASVQRIAQMARAAGIHLIMATQRPSVDVITGTIKANFPTRISFQVTSKIDSRTILGEAGAEQLLGQGDMLYMANGGRITRVHGPLVTDDEVEKVVKHIKKQTKPQYVHDVTAEETESDFTTMTGLGGLTGNTRNKTNTIDALYDQAVAIVCQDRKASTSYIQRRLQIGYNRAARLIDQMEDEGVISKANHVGKREVLARKLDDPIL
tara:strand:- start:3435 stop:5867 length:2433 start_codon:yes stop_codon:yes gene_type:complete